MREAVPHEVAARERGFNPGIDAVVLEISRAGMVRVETARHAFLRRPLELVALALEALDHAIERVAAAIVEDRFAIALEHLRLRHVETDREDDSLRMEI